MYIFNTGVHDIRRSAMLSYGKDDFWLAVCAYIFCEDTPKEDDE